MRLTYFVATFVLGFVFGLLATFKSRDESPDESVPLGALANQTGESFPFASVIEETTEQKIIPLNPDLPPHLLLQSTVLETARQISQSLSSEDSPAREKKRINEVSALFEEALLTRLDHLPDFSCRIPLTAEGKAQRSGYPDLRVEHLPSGTVAYLDPKLFAEKSRSSTLRTFYFEPAGKTSKVTENALHLLLGFPHDSNTGEWTFAPAELVDLAELEVTLKAEFSASNKELYQSGSED